MVQIVSLLAAALLLAAYAANQTGRISAGTLGYSIANGVASGTLAVVAVLEQQWGFLLLEGVWCAISVAGGVRVVWARPA